MLRVKTVVKSFKKLKQSSKTIRILSITVVISPERLTLTRRSRNKNRR